MTATAQTAQVTLRDLVRKTAHKNPRLQPDDIVRRVVRNTPQDLMIDFYAEALRPLVSDVLRGERNEAINGTPIPISTNGRSNVSAKLQALRAIDWDDVFAARVCITGRWMAIGDCSADELDTYATDLRNHAAATLAHASFYEDLAARMRDSGVNSARELDMKDLP